MSLYNGDHNHQPQLLVLGAGLARTGTRSLKKALELLYKQPCYHGFKVAELGTLEVAKWNKVCDKFIDNPGVELTRDDFGPIFDNYSMAIDNPTNGFVFHLMRIYPEAKIILTVRDPQAWIKSVRSTVLPKEPYLSRSSWIDRLVEWIVLGANFTELAEKSFRIILGTDIDITDDNQLVEGFIAWNDKVKKLVPPERLLVFEVSQGWGPLCKFLNFSVPDNQPFPHVNDERTLKQWIEKKQEFRIHVHVAVYALLTIGMAAIGYWLVKDVIWLGLPDEFF